MDTSTPLSADAPGGPKRIIDQMRKRSMTLACAESVTGGLLTGALIDPAGASDVVAGGVCTYATRAKIGVLGVDSQVISRRGTVDEEVARDMAIRVRELFETSWGISTTGVAGPGEHEGHPAGTVIVGIAHEELSGGCVTERVQLSGSRTEIRKAAIHVAMENLWEQIQALGC